MIPALNSIVLAGGASRRFGGRDKALLDVAGRPFVQVIIDDLAGFSPHGQRVVVGPVRDGVRGTDWTMEDPPGGGPLTGVSAGVQALRDPTEWTFVLACDAPFSARALPALWQLAEAAISTVDVVAAVDGDGRFQPLVALYRTGSLDQALESLREGAQGDARLQGLPLRALTAELTRVEVPIPAHLVADCDTPEDFAALMTAIHTENAGGKND
ncbi:molybdenum cofactor guanylyltransferase [Timonella senegalensis]|uniref:molybdenum cofactor guanylyltransferase n=1 Tax=Timonella senegalensis TaxID=1465825 RepID=UPI0002F8B66C|nr:molybdenum cofactor guanylyltransferase [Timonella senegalensis]